MAEPRVLFNHRPRYVLGPLGLYERGQRLEIEGKEVIVVNIDHDGAGVALTTEFLQAKAVEAGDDLDWAIGHYVRSRTCDPPKSEASDRPAELITRTIMFNRRQAGLDETDPREAKLSF